MGLWADERVDAQLTRLPPPNRHPRGSPPTGLRQRPKRFQYARPIFGEAGRPWVGVGNSSCSARRVPRVSPQAPCNGRPPRRRRRGSRARSPDSSPRASRRSVEAVLSGADRNAGAQARRGAPPRRAWTGGSSSCPPGYSRWARDGQLARASAGHMRDANRGWVPFSRLGHGKRDLEPDDTGASAESELANRYDEPFSCGRSIRSCSRTVGVTSIGTAGVV